MFLRRAVLEKNCPVGTIGQKFEGTLLDHGGDFLACLRIACIPPLHAQLFELFVARPAEPRLVAIGGEELDPAGTSNSMNVRLTEAEIHAVSTACRTAVSSHG